jgi:adenylate cyclase
MPSPSTPPVAVMVADAAGYSRAVCRDEAAALAALDDCRRIIDPSVAAHGGRIFATAGDGVLAEFATAGAAVDAAVAIQRRIAAAQAAGQSLLGFRIGVHAGPVHRAGGDLLGGTVNVAARLEGLANTGGVCISGDVHAALGPRPDLVIEPLGLRLLKHVEAPVPVLRIRLGEPDREHVVRDHRFKVAVLPFAVAGDAPDYLAEGLADELSGALARFRGLAVLSRGVTADAADLLTLGRRLGCDFVVRGVLRGRSARLDLVVELVDAAEGVSLGRDRHAGSLDDLLTGQDALVERLVATLAAQIADSSVEASRRKQPESLQSFDLYLQGVHFANRTDPAATAKALERLEAALALEPDYAAAMAWLALMRLRRWAWSPGDPSALAPVTALARQALALDPADAWCHLVLGQVQLYAGEDDAAQIHHRKAAALNPYDTHVLALRSPLAVYRGKPEEAVLLIERALGLTPRPPDWYATNLGLALYCAGRYAEAAAAYQGIATPQTGALANLAASLAQAGDREGAARVRARLLEREPAFSSRFLGRLRPFRHEADRAHVEEGMRLAGLPA